MGEVEETGSERLELEEDLESLRDELRFAESRLRRARGGVGSSGLPGSVTRQMTRRESSEVDQLKARIRVIEERLDEIK